MFKLRPVGIALAAGCFLAACGGGSGGSGGGNAPATTGVEVTVIDGAIEKATVCLDANANGDCDAGEPTGTTNAAGKSTLQVDNADVGRYAVLAVVGTDARDADTGPVTTPFTLSAPADRTAVVSPLTTLVHTAMASSGLSSTEAEAVVRSQAGLELSLFADYTAAADGTGTAAAALARMVVLVTQQHNSALAASVGQQAGDGSTISAADVQDAVRRNVLQALDSLASAAAQPEVLAAATPAARDRALAPHVTAAVRDSGLSAATLAAVVAVNNQLAQPGAATAHVPTGGASLAGLDFTDGSNYYLRVLTSSLAQDTPDAEGRLRYQDRRFRASGGAVAAWSAGTSPARNADLHWNGTSWENCGLNSEHVATVRDAQGRGSYVYCNQRERGVSIRATMDVAGKKLREVYDSVRATGYTSVHIAAPSLLGDAIFPAGAKLYYQTNTVTVAAPVYYPGRGALPNTGNTVWLSGVAAGAGGDARTQSGLACAGALATVEVTTLESLIAQAQGAPCIYGQQSFTYGGQTYSSDVPSTQWGNTTVSLGSIGTAPVNSGTAPGYYTTNVRLRVAFKGSGANATTYYSCKERFNDGSTRQCVEIGTGSYSIEQLGNARVMRFLNLPPQAGALSYTRAFVERGGVIYFGYQNRLGSSNVARFNAVAAGALLGQLGLTVPDPAQPLMLTAASYQGNWDLWDAVNNPGRTGGLALSILANGTARCSDIGGTGTEACTLNFTDTATGAFALAAGDEVITGSVDFLGGSAAGTYSDPQGTPTSGSFVGWRR